MDLDIEARTEGTVVSLADGVANPWFKSSSVQSVFLKNTSVRAKV